MKIFFTVGPKSDEAFLFGGYIHLVCSKPYTSRLPIALYIYTGELRLRVVLLARRHVYRSQSKFSLDSV